MLKRIHVFVSGRVQGVAFRWVTSDVALQLKVFGWARNLPDGRVEVVAEGEEENLKQFIEFLNKGPRYAKVRNIEIEWIDYIGEFASFEIRY